MLEILESTSTKYVDSTLFTADETSIIHRSAPPPKLKGVKLRNIIIISYLYTSFLVLEAVSHITGFFLDIDISYLPSICAYTSTAIPIISHNKCLKLFIL